MAECVIGTPDGPHSNITGLGTARVTWQPVKDVLIYHCTVQEIDEPNIRPASYNVSDNKLDVQDILPCSTYLISVSSFNKFLVLSESTETHSPPTAFLSDMQNMILRGKRVQMP
ncbi:hypothetical protein F7725_027981 [Dissostichus mawsoni]|uniref:Fibronectin type-III domain-containing protein n=1 Tax=Dissostichus mawsoni TaxID=36200 RepID=A0A7J5XEZ9_DISMA|nr:hypothetical protein F7725_027981 [Dissostichus mawsoni]